MPSLLTTEHMCAYGWGVILMIASSASFAACQTTTAAEDDGGPQSDQDPGHLCTDPTEVHLVAREFDFPILCGCQEPPGEEDMGSKLCTIRPGKKVIWMFQGGEEHDIKSLTDAFGRSGEMRAGSFEIVFDEAGTYEYRCSLHPSEMTGYTILVEE